jgi:hypothetical protein
MVGVYVLLLVRYVPDDSLQLREFGQIAVHLGKGLFATVVGEYISDATHWAHLPEAPVMEERNESN